jgi:hypothetical protein
MSMAVRFFRDRFSEILLAFYGARAKSSIGVETGQVWGVVGGVVSVLNAAISYDNEVCLYH